MDAWASCCYKTDGVGGTPTFARSVTLRMGHTRLLAVDCFQVCGGVSLAYDFVLRDGGFEFGHLGWG